MKRILLAAVVFLVVNGSAAASVLIPGTVKEGVEACESDKLYMKMWCAGLTHGIFTTLKFTSQICIYDEGVTLGQQIQTFIEWGKKTPDMRTKDPALGFALSMIDRWPPCPSE
jgi:hypothetical protein